jgi:hypothetical protein
MSTEQELINHLDEVNKVVTEYLKGQDPTKISKELDIPRTRVVSLINEWKVMASANDAIRARAKEALAGADTHYSKLITKAYEVIDEASMTNNLSAKTQAIKLVMDIEKSRIEMLQKAGLLENKELAEEMVEIERRQEVLVEILREIASTHPEVRDLIMQRLSQIAK